MNNHLSDDLLLISEFNSKYLLVALKYKFGNWQLGREPVQHIRKSNSENRSWYAWCRLSRVWFLIGCWPFHVHIALCASYWSFPMFTETLTSLPDKTLQPPTFCRPDGYWQNYYLQWPEGNLMYGERLHFRSLLIAAVMKVSCIAAQTLTCGTRQVDIFLLKVQ